MSEQTRSIARGKSLMGFALVLVLSAFLFTVTACEDLTSDTVAPTTTIPDSTTQTSAAEESTSAASVFGTWDGTYTALEAWDENGVVEDPPISLHQPMELHLELHPWSEGTGDYGTLSATGFASGRVTALSFDGQNVR
jgi:hypothetical protein